MNILNVNISIDSLHEGGTAERTYQMSRFLAKEKNKCTILTLYSELSEKQYTELSGINIIMLPYLFKRFYLPKSGLSKIKKAVKEADIIHLMSHWTILNALAYCYIRYYGKPYVVCPAGALPVFGRSKIIKKVFNYLIGNKIIRNAHGHIAIAENEVDQYQLYGIKKDQITLIPNGINLHDFQHQAFKLTPQSLSVPNPYILFIGRLNYIKGPDILLRAFAKLPKCYSHIHLVFAGPDAGMLVELHDIVKEVNLAQRVHFIGQVNGLDKVCIYNNAIFLAVPSRQEAMSIVLLEAGILEKPVLITDQCGFSHLEKIEGGYVVAANEEAIASGLINMLSTPNLELMGINLKNYIVRHYTWDTIGEKILSFYRKLLT